MSVGDAPVAASPVSSIPDIQCPCCGDLIICCGCSTGTARRWLLQVTGISNGTCTACNQYNGTFILFELILNSCFWVSNLPDAGGISNPCRGTFAAWQLSCTHIIANGVAGTAIATYSLAGTWQCRAQNTFVLVDQDDQCIGFPTQLTINPLSTGT